MARELLPKLTSDVEFAGGQIHACEITDDLKAQRYMKAAREAFRAGKYDAAQFFVQAAQVHATLATIQQ